MACARGGRATGAQAILTVKPDPLCGIEGFINAKLYSAAPALLLLMSLAVAGCQQSITPRADPQILFTQVPEANPGDHDRQDVIEGTVHGARPGQRMILYSKSGGLWWVQPLLTSPFTAILPDRSWRNETHFGTEYAVLLVDPSYHPAANLRDIPKPGGLVSAVAVTLASVPQFLSFTLASQA